jgi:hypothetical protein
VNIIVMADGHEINVEHGLGIVTIEAVAHSLAQINRFNGHAARPYSVAEHSLLVVEILERQAHQQPSANLLFAALMHDAHEAISSDMHSPGKAVIGAAWHHWEERFESLVRSAFHLHTAAASFRHLVAQADLIALATERRDLMPHIDGFSSPWPVLAGVQAVDWVHLRDPIREATSWDQWRDRFIEKARELASARTRELQPA